ncbi:DNA-binding transcriptional LysR family regulator [Providencia alcalifaciens]|nr:DNA-binding transcriptional LysR family regulator [Providencia alcalifaciens]
MDRIKQAKAFIQVIETGSFTKAAVVLNIPRSTISTVIQSLEDRLRTQLLYRTTRQVIPTHDGLLYLEAARKFIETFEDSESLFLKNKQHLTGYLRIDLPTRIGTQVVIPNLNSFIKEYPKINLTLSMSDRPIDLLSEGVDCALRVGVLPDSGLVCRKLGELDMINCASPNYLSRYGCSAQLNQDTFLKEFCSYSIGDRSPLAV